MGLDADVSNHSTFSKNRHGRFRESDLLRKLFKTVVARCMKEGIVGGEAFAVVASMIVADAHRRRGVAKVEDLDPTSSRAVAKYLSVLDDAAFGGATPVEPRSISPTDPAARYKAAADTPAVYAYSDSYLTDLKHAVIMDVEVTTAIRQAEVGAAKTMLDRTAEQSDVRPPPPQRRERKKVEMLFSHLKRILRLDRLRLRAPSGAKDEFLLAATAQNLRKLAKLIPLAPIFAT